MAKDRLELYDKYGNKRDVDISTEDVTLDNENGKSLKNKLGEIDNEFAQSVKRVVFNGDTHTINGGSVNIGNQMQADWNESSPSYPAFIKNKPNVVTGIKIGDSGSTITPTNGVITLPENEGGGGSTPDVAMSDTSTNAVQNKVIKAYVDAAVAAVQTALNTLIGGNVQGAIDTFNEVTAFLNGIDTSDPTLKNQLKSLSDAISDLQTALAAKVGYSDDEWLQVKAGAMQAATAVQNTTTVNGKRLNNNIVIGMADIPGLLQAIANAGSGAVSVTTNQDGTFTIHVGDDAYTVNLNHTHENMCKLIVCEESDLPSTLAKDTIYAQVNDADNPTEIEVLYIAGLEFVGGGGGSADDGMPKVTSPKDESTLNLGENSGSGVSKTIVVKAKNLNYGGSTTGLTIEAIGTGLSLSYGQQTGQSSITIPQSNGVVNTEITVAFGGSGGLDDGELRFKQGSSVLASVVVVVVEALPEGFVEDTAWNGDNMVGSDVDKYTAPGYQEGYVTTPFYNVTHQGVKVDLMIKSGCVSGVDLPKVIDVFKTSPSDANTFAAYLHSPDPNRRTLKADSGYKQNYISATMKRSELRNCYIYDYGAGAYLFAGANVDTSTPPQ